MATNFQKKLAKKTAENPAMMFISQPGEAEAQAEEPKKSRPALKGKAQGETPLLQAEETSAAPIRATATRTQSATPPRREAKTRRLQLLLQPSLYEEIRAKAEAEGLSVNEEIGKLLRSALNK